MKKIIKLLLCISLLLLCVGCSNNNSSDDDTSKQEPLYYSDDIRIISKDVKDVSELANKVLAVQKSFDKEYSDYVIEQLK